MQADRKACATNTGSKPKIYINAGAISNAFGISDSTENAQKMQCFKCNPPLHKPPGAMKLCPNCEAEAEQTAIAFFDNFRRHRTVYKLNRYCFSCSEWKTEAMMSKQLQICRICADKLKSKGATAQNNFIAHALNNFHKKLKGVTNEQNRF